MQKLRTAKKWLSLAMALVMMASMAACQPKAEELETYENPELMERIGNASTQYAADNEIVGMSMAVIDNGKVAYLNYGNLSVDGGQPVDENTIYQIASVTKTFTATMLAEEVNDGKMKLDDPLKKYLDYDFVDELEGETITLERVANHTSGLPRMPRNWKDGPNPYKNYTHELQQEYMTGKFRLRDKPGTVYQYSNLGYSLLGDAIEKVEGGKSFEEIVTEKICKPLGMTSTYVLLDEETHKRKASPYRTKDVPGNEWDFGSMEGCIALQSTTRDLARYVAGNLGQLDGGEKLKAAMELAHEPTYTGGPTLGLAWRHTSANGHTFLEHDGLIVGGYTSYVAFHKETGTGVVILCNSGDGVIPLGVSVMDMLISNTEKTM